MQFAFSKQIVQSMNFVLQWDKETLQTGMLEERETWFLSNSLGDWRVRQKKKIDPVPMSSPNTLAPQSRKGFIKIYRCSLTPVPHKHIFQGQQQSHWAERKKHR